MLKRALYSFIAVLLTASCAFGANGQVVADTQDMDIIAARTGHVASVQAITFVANSATSVTFYVYSGTTYLFGTPTNPIVIDRDSIDGANAIGWQWNAGGWASSEKGTAVKIHLSSTSTPVTVHRTFEYRLE